MWLLSEVNEIMHMKCTAQDRIHDVNSFRLVIGVWDMFLESCKIIKQYDDMKPFRRIYRFLKIFSSNDVGKPALWKKKKLWIMTSSNFWDVNTPTIANFKLPKWDHRMQNWREILTVVPCKLARTSSDTLLLSSTLLKRYHLLRIPAARKLHKSRKV